MATSAITTYMNDHLGGSAAAVELLDRLIERARTPQDATFYSDIRTEVEADRSTLADLIKRVGGTPSMIREAGGWLGAKFTNLKLKLGDTTGGDLERLEALEALVVGIHGKSRLWRALAAAAPGLPELQSVDFAELERRADDQHARVEARRLEAAARALTPGPDVKGDAPARR